MANYTNRTQRMAFYERCHKALVGRGRASRLVIPEGVQMVEFHEPCFMCGTRGVCRHRRSYSQDVSHMAVSAP